MLEVHGIALGDRPSPEFNGGAAKSEMVSKQYALILSVDAGPFAGRKLVVPNGETRTVGRTSLSDLATEDGFMSGVHFSIHSNGDFAEIRDMGSTNKTYVNGVSVVSVKLSPNDRIRAGKTLFSISWESSNSDSNGPSLHGDSICPVLTAETAVPEIVRETQPWVEKSDRNPAVENENIEFIAKNEIEAKLAPSVLPSFDSSPAPSEPPAKRKNFSPFDSVDQSFVPQNVSSGELPWVSPGQDKILVRNFDSPFEDSVDESALVKETIPEEESQPNRDSIPARYVPDSKFFLRLRQRPSDRKEFDFCQILSRLSIQNPCRVVAHFLKVGERLPRELIGESVVPQLGQGNEYFPALIELEKWHLPQMLPVTHQLMLADGIMLVIVNENLNANQVLQNITSRGAPGFSAPNGLLTWFWPSQFFAMAERLSDLALFNLFGNEIEGIVAAVPQLENELYAVATHRVAELLQEFGFREQ